MRILDLFCGLKGFSKPFRDRGHTVITLDIDEGFDPDIVMDVMALTPALVKESIRPDVVLASPPCEKFSVMSAKYYWKNGVPNAEALKAIELVKHTLSLIYDVHPRYWFLENPRGMLRTVIGLPPVTVFYAQFGVNYLKPTDLWGRHPRGFANIIVKDKEALEYEKVSSGEQKGVLALSDAAERALIPYKLSETICEFCEKGIKGDFDD